MEAKYAHRSTVNTFRSVQGDGRVGKVVDSMVFGRQSGKNAMESKMLNQIYRAGAIASLFTLALPMPPAVADEFRSDFPEDLSRQCHRAIAQTRNATQVNHKTTIRYASVDAIPDNHPYYAATYNMRPHNLYLSLEGENEAYEGDVAYQSSALELLEHTERLSKYAWDLVDNCETVGLVTFAMNEYQVRQFGLGEVGFTEFKCWEGMPPDTPVPCWRPD